MTIEEQSGPTRSPNETEGTRQRSAHPLAGPTLTFDLAAELERLRHEESYRASDRNARTLAKEGGLRIVLTALKDGARLREHSAPGPVSIQTLAGRIRLHAAGETVDLPVGALLALDGNVTHDVEALEESAFLLTIVWPEGAGADG